MRIKTLSQIAAIGLVVGGMVSAQTQAQNFERGQELFQHQCGGCHGDLVVADKQGKAKTLEELRKKIASWADHSGAEWGNSEVDDVLYYMNKSFYHFKEVEN